MSIPDPVATGIVTAGALQLAKQAQDFIAAASGHPGESLGEIFGGWSRRRMQNVEAVGNRARLILLNLGVEPKPVPLKVIQPLVEAASMEEEPDIQELWARLLAGSASGGILFVSAFIDILRQLSTEEARFLKALTEWLDKEVKEYEADPQKARTYPSERIGSFEPLTNLFHESNGIRGADADSGEARHFAAVAFDNLGRLGIMSPPAMGMPSFRVTNFGLHFLSTFQDQKSVEPAEKS